MGAAQRDESQSLELQRHPDLLLVMNTPKGNIVPSRGVFASSDIPRGVIIDVSPVLVLNPNEADNHLKHTQLYHYTYNWPFRDASSNLQCVTQAVVLGLGSMFNHSTLDQNVGWIRDVERQVVTYTTLRNVKKGEELCISYGTSLTFQDVDASASVATNIDGWDMLQHLDID
ncbi:MAG: hypothetical protein M1833_005295 [Piccolia ochrophora]|nr:MAG: hypothetical protein M1833_005295 [Piccolia ochrophora]